MIHTYSCQMALHSSLHNQISFTSGGIDSDPQALFQHSFANSRHIILNLLNCSCLQKVTQFIINDLPVAQKSPPPEYPLFLYGHWLNANSTLIYMKVGRKQPFKKKKILVSLKVMQLFVYYYFLLFCSLM